MLRCLKIVFWGFYHLDFFEFLIAWSVKTWWGSLNYFKPDSFVENKNSDMKVICSDLHIFCHNVSVQDKGYEQVQQISSRSTECIFAGPRIDLMSRTFLFYIVKGFGLIKRGMRVKRKCNHFKCNQGFSTKAACHKKKKTYLSSGNYKICFIIPCCHACLVRIISCFWIADSM
jgi:hypothetical protein